MTSHTLLIKGVKLDIDSFEDIYDLEKAITENETSGDGAIDVVVVHNEYDSIDIDAYEMFQFDDIVDTEPTDGSDTVEIPAGKYLVSLYDFDRGYDVYEVTREFVDKLRPKRGTQTGTYQFQTS